jgi:hypothetical protein
MTTHGESVEEGAPQELDQASFAGETSRNAIVLLIAEGRNGKALEELNERIRDTAVENSQLELFACSDSR